MATNGINGTVLVNQYDLSQYFTSFNVSQECDEAETTGFSTGSDKNFDPTNSEMGISLEGLFVYTGTPTITSILEAALGGANDVIALAPLGMSNPNAATVPPSQANPTAVNGVPAYVLAALFKKYGVKNPVGDVIRTALEGKGDPGYRCLVLCSALSVGGPSGSGATLYDGVVTTVDGNSGAGSSTANGYVVFYMVTSNTQTATTNTPRIQHSRDASTWVTLSGITFPNLAGGLGSGIVFGNDAALFKYVRGGGTNAGGTVGGTTVLHMFFVRL